MPDTITHSPHHVHAEWAELRPSLDRVALQARALIASLGDIPRPLFSGERIWSDAKKVAFAERLCGEVVDLLADLTDPLLSRADNAGVEPERFTIDLSDLRREYAALEREASQTCVTGRK